MSSDADAVKIEDQSQVRRILIDRAERDNMLSLPMIDVLAAAVRAAPADIKVIHLSGAGNNFCLGRDPQGSPSTANALAIRQTLIEPILRLYDAVKDCPVPIVCSVQGFARGLGAALACACDLTIAAQGARFCLPEMEKNLPPTLAMSALRTFASPKILSYLVYSMDDLDAVMARNLGLVGQVVGDVSLSAETERVIATMKARSREALVAVKEYQRASEQMGSRAARDMAANLLANVLASASK